MGRKEGRHHETSDGQGHRMAINPSAVGLVVHQIRIVPGQLTGDAPRNILMIELLSNTSN
jgi:hypothetical protein